MSTTSTGFPPPPRAWLVLAVILGAAHLLLYRAPFDDAYISYRYARHVAEGLGFVYNPGERVEGFTSFGWVVLLSGFALVHLPLPLVAVVLSAACGLALVVATERLARKLFPDSPWAPLAAFLVSASGTWAYYAMSGMETTAFCLLLVVALLACLSPGRGLAIGVLFALATLLRPEGLGYFALTAAVLVLDGPSRRRALVALASYAALVAPFVLWRWRYFGYPLPNTFYVKVAGGAALLGAGWRHLEQFFTLHLFWLVPGALLLRARRRGLDLGLRLCAAWLLGAIANVLLVGGDAFAFFRFFLPVIPLGAALFTTLVAALAERARPRAVPVAAAVALVALAFAAELVPRRTFSGRGGASNFRQVRSVARVMREHVAVGRWLRQAVPPTTWLAVNPAGIIPYESGLATIDMLGLTDAHIAHRPAVIGQGARGHEKHDAAYVLGRAPDLIIPGLPLLSSRPLRGPDLASWFGRWFEFLPGDRELFANPALSAGYGAVTVQILPGRYLTLFVNRRSPSFQGLFGKRP